MRCLVLLGSLCCLVGCQDASLISKIDEITRKQADFHATLAELTENNRQLEARLAVTTTQLQENADKFASLEEEQKRFEAAFSPELRPIFDQNLKLAQQLVVDLKATKEELLQECRKSREGMVAEVQATKEACDQALTSLRTTVDDTSKLKERCVQSAKEANDANLVGALKESVSKLDQSVKELSGLGANLTQVQSKITQLESSINFVKLDVQTSKTELQLLRSKVR